MSSSQHLIWQGTGLISLMVLGRKCLVAQPQHFTGNESVSFLICSDNVIMPCGSHHAGHVQGCRRLALGQWGWGATEACWVGLDPLQTPSAPSDYIIIRARAWAKSTDPHKYKAGRICCYTKIRNNHLHYKNHQKSCHSEWFDVFVQEANSAWRQKPNFT